MKILSLQLTGFQALKKSKIVSKIIIMKFLHRVTREKVYKKRASLMRKSMKDLPSVAKKIEKSIQRANKIYFSESLTSYRNRLFGLVSTNSESQTNSNSYGQLMGRSASERARHLRFTNLQLMKNFKNFWIDEAKKHGSCYFNSIYLLCFFVISIAWL